MTPTQPTPDNAPAPTIKESLMVSPAVNAQRPDALDYAALKGNCLALESAHASALTCIAKMREQINRAIVESRCHNEYNPFGKKHRTPMGYQNIERILLEAETLTVEDMADKLKEAEGTIAELRSFRSEATKEEDKATVIMHLRSQLAQSRQEVESLRLELLGVQSMMSAHLKTIHDHPRQ